MRRLILAVACLVRTATCRERKDGKGGHERCPIVDRQLLVLVVRVRHLREAYR
jgi:hypothetical protein